MTDALPQPTTTRWQPLRLGLVDLFYYDDEQFWFHDGRLLLRGNNGTGKSKVLALTLPFLLDGSQHPRRVEPDADPKKRMDWNLLMNGAHPGRERTGYSWVEFGRIDESGEPSFTTLAIGLKAAAGRGVVKTWYAVASRRIGDLRLVDDARVALTQERLRDELHESASGRVFTTQRDYRRAVDEALFGLGEERYGALVDLLIQLRQPQLSKDPDEKALSAALTEALTPLDQAVVADVAESFRSLEEERDGIAATRETLSVAEDFLTHYRAYAQVAARRHTSAMREANSVYEKAGREVREAESEAAEVDEELAGLRRAEEEASARRVALEGREEVLRTSPEMKDAEHLDRSRRDAVAAESVAAEAEAERDQARQAAEREERAEQAALADLEQAEERARRRREAAGRDAVAAGLADEHADLLDDEQAAARAVRRRRDQVAHVRDLVETRRRADEDRDRCRAEVDRAESERARRIEDERAAEVAVEAAVAAHGEAVGSYARTVRVLRLTADVEELVAAAQEWARGQQGDSPADLAMKGAAAEAQAEIAAERADARQALDRVEVELAGVTAEITALEAGHDPEPAPAPGRDPAARADAVGAPLWRLTDFAADLGDAERAGLEAALQSAGLLDAWIFPDGSLRADGDVVLSGHGPEVSASLAGRLVAAVGPDGEVPAEVVDGVLRRIGYGERSGAAIWADDGGAWGAGPVRGSWHKGAAEHIGAGAREASRRERIATLRDRADDLRSRGETERSRVEVADERARLVRDEVAAYPRESEHTVLLAHERATVARQERERSEAVVVGATTRWERARRHAEEAAAEASEQAEQLRLPTDLAALCQVEQAVSDYSHRLAEVRHTTSLSRQAQQVSDQARERAERSTDEAGRRDRRAQEAREAATGARSRFEELQATVGASVAELEEQLSQVAVELAQVRQAAQEIARRQLDAVGRQGALEQKVVDLRERREAQAAGRERAAEVLRSFADTGLLRVALPDQETPPVRSAEDWTVTAALAVAREAEVMLGEVDASDQRWSRSQQQVSTAATELTSQMSRHGHTATQEMRGDVIVVRVRYQGEPVDVDRLAARLAEDVAERERLLNAREREVLENHLVNEVAGHLHELVSGAEAQIDRMNRELADRKTSTGMRLRMRWKGRADGPVGLEQARRLLVRADATWTPEDRTALGDFLQAQIDEVRQSDPTGGWQEHLTQALDYRRWHSFVVEIQQNGQWRPASGPASGGEKVLAVSIPLFAAASAHYNSASSSAPRLILLDEAFAGVDDDSRAKSLGLLATFDMDVVMTSEREWGCYPDVPGLAIAQLSRAEGYDAVGVTRWRWDGRRRVRLGEMDEAARAVGGSGPDPGETLFA
ncbi:MAG: TIGR02680 family protein [Aeromicrobium sp.]|uniref:TIGR02680 family protein n=1 Tax=Aeromicrobium sp. TaxID=1871063 RepID=UPI0039E33BD1